MFERLVVAVDALQASGLRHLSRGVSNFRHFLRGNLANAKPSAFNWLVVVSVSVRLWQVACTLFGCGRRADIRACYPVRGR